MLSRKSGIRRQIKWIAIFSLWGLSLFYVSNLREEQTLSCATSIGNPALTTLPNVQNRVLVSGNQSNIGSFSRHFCVCNIRCIYRHRNPQQHHLVFHFRPPFCIRMTLIERTSLLLAEVKTTALGIRYKTRLTMVGI